MNLLLGFQAKKKMVKLVQKIIQSKREGRAGIVSMAPKDVAEVLLNDASEQLTDDLIADNMIDMMIPGEDSVPVLMTLAVKYLSDCPAALQQLTVCMLINLFISQLPSSIYIFLT
jgi:3-epi-6-deoxocathasterone 23-monooxygenase